VLRRSLDGLLLLLGLHRGIALSLRLRLISLALVFLGTAALIGATPILGLPLRTP
jgi:hypothetical protein